MHKEREQQQHMSVAEDAALTGRAYRLRSSSLQAWLPLTAPTADKSGNIKENRRAAQSTHQCFFSSSPPRPTIPTTTSTSGSFYSSFFPVPNARVSELSRAGSDITRIRQQSRGSSCQRQPVLCQASPRQAVIQPSSRHIKTPRRGGEGRRERKN